MTKQMIRDDAGYINNRGKSKYWGVTTGENSNGKDFWVVSYTPADKSETLTIHPSGFALTEQEAAMVAAFAFDKGKGRHTLNGKSFTTANGKEELRVRGNRITKHSMDVLPPAPVKATTYHERLSDLIAFGNLSEQSCKTLANLLKF